MNLIYNKLWHKFICVLLGIFLSVSAARSQKTDVSHSIEGQWEFKYNEKGRKHRFVFEFISTGNGSYKGNVYSYLDNNYMGIMKLGKIEFKNPNLRLVANPAANVIIEGAVDFNKQIIEGKLLYTDGTSRPLTLKCIKPEKTSKQIVFTGSDSPAYIYKPPEKTVGGWDISTLRKENLDVSLIETAVNKIIKERCGMLNSFLIIKNGKLVCEEYFNRFSREIPHRTASVTKSITSLLIGIAIDKGFIKDVNTTAFEFFPEYKELRTDAWDKISVKHFLIMSAGLKWDKNNLNNFHKNDNPIKTILLQEPVYEPGKHFEYISGNMTLLAGIIKQATGMHADAFADKYLFKPLGIKKYDWDINRKNGYPDCGGSLMLRPRDMAKIGLLVLNKGKWENKQIVSEAWIEESTKVYIESEEYGYLWWLAWHSIEGHDVRVIFANGWGSQFIFIFPDLDMVMVTTGNNEDNGKHIVPMRVLGPLVVKAAL